MGLFANLVFGALRTAVILTVYAENPGAGGYDSAQAVTYVWLTQSLVAVVQIFGGLDLGDRIRSGDISVDLARPADLQAVGLASDIGRSLYHLVFRAAIPLAVGALGYGLILPADPVRAAIFVSSVLMAVCVSYMLRFIYAVSAFWTSDHRGIATLGSAAAQVLSGFLLPTAFLPGPFQALADASPFPAMVQAPIDVYLGIGDGASLLATQAGWLLGLVAVGRILLSYGKRRLSTQGG